MAVKSKIIEKSAINERCMCADCAEMTTFAGMKTKPTQLEALPTPCYLYDMSLLRDTVDALKAAIAARPVHVHYAMKANSNPEILRLISGAGFGVDCVSGGEVRLALECGFRAADISYAGVGKTDDEINLGLDEGIGCFNVESIEELALIGEIAGARGMQAPVALRINPDIDAHTHRYITTGLKENKFGIDRRLLDKAMQVLAQFPSLRLKGLHFHIGSQILTPAPFVELSARVNDIVELVTAHGHNLEFINMGGGFGIDYDAPDENPITDFKPFIDAIMDNLRLDGGRHVIIEPGRSLVAQCGTLLARVIYVKEGIEKKFIILDAGMNNLIRPALYGAHHNIENVSTRSGTTYERYDVVGPICETADVFAENELLPRTRRGDIIAIRSAGAYGESMSSTYNTRPLQPSLFRE